MPAPSKGFRLDKERGPSQKVSAFLAAQAGKSKREIGSRNNPAAENLLRVHPGAGFGPAVLGEGPGQSEAHGAGFIGAARHLTADDHRAVHFADQTFQFEGAVIKHFRMSGDGNLTAAVEPGEQAAFGFHADAGRTVFHEGQHLGENPCGPCGIRCRARPAPRRG